MLRLFDGNGLGQVTWEIDVETFGNSKPVGHELERNDVEKTLQTVDSLWNLDLLGLTGLELFVVRVTDDNWLAGSCDDY